MDDELRLGIFEPHVGDHCGWKCPYPDRCIYLGGTRSHTDPDR